MGTGSSRKNRKVDIAAIAAINAGSSTMLVRSERNDRNRSGQRRNAPTVEEVFQRQEAGVIAVKRVERSGTKSSGSRKRKHKKRGDANCVASR